ncbi:MAG: phosphate signaling complex protein PhoU [Deltaproteobacteria bacterium]|nr:phosphate signaling complex protein PhoU [Deltaproteobacteria bacterium]
MPNEEKELSKIRGTLAYMATVMKGMFERSYRAIASHDEDLARQVIQDDSIADNLETELEELALRHLALYAPKAQELRYVVAVLRLATDMERVSDHATAMARQVFSSHLSPFVASFPTFGQMVDLSSGLLTAATDSLFKLEDTTYKRIQQELKTIKEFKNNLEQQLVQSLSKDPELSQPIVSFLNVIRRVDRVAGHARNIAVMVPYITQGTLYRHKTESEQDADTLD